ncbi:MAG: 5-oxoprolinase subunit PxpB [Candidatus Bathyarchaeota archaeon]|nr:5-oxoprolinase subunit PxpB [Candidatus Bathyarchaeota archaeon]MDW8040231.1 5-oxoprolinase subunit PxpB [Nitrososphaerota archaeon]
MNGVYLSARYLPFGDAALTVEFGTVINLAVNHKVIALNEALMKASIPGIEELVPTYRSLLIRYDPAKITYERLVAQIREVEEKLKETPREKKRKLTVPVVYGGVYGPDLGFVADYHGSTESQVVKFHSGKEYRVYMIGFVAGFPYLGDVPDEIATPRLETPRLRVPAGSVGIAEKQTGIYPCEAPGGWRIIGRTPIKLFDPQWQPPALLKPGDTVKFKPISEGEFQRIERLVAIGAYKPQFEE